MINRILPIVAIAALTLTGCQESADETAQDVSDARKEANENIADARTDANETMLTADENESDAIHTYANSDAKAQVKLRAAEADAISERARADYDLAIATSKGTHEVEVQKCDALDAGVDRTACKTTADAVLATATADAKARRDEALMTAKNYE
jgi:hypothetical protein